MEYAPSAETLARIKDVDFVGVVGISGAGKSTLMAAAHAQDPGIRLAIITTSRTLRPDEQDGVDVHIRSEADMRRRAEQGKYLVAIPNMLAWYALDPADCPPGIVLMPMIARSKLLYAKLPFRSFRTICILPPSHETWQARWNKRAFSSAQVKSRLAEARQSLEFAAQSPGPFIINDDLKAAVSEFVRVVRGGKPRTSTTGGQRLARAFLEQI